MRCIAKIIFISYFFILKVLIKSEIKYFPLHSLNNRVEGSFKAIFDMHKLKKKIIPPTNKYSELKNIPKGLKIPAFITR